MTNRTKLYIKIAVGAAILIVGCFLTFSGVRLFVAGPGGDVTCSGTVMHEGDLCEHTTDGKVTDTLSYQEEKESQNSSSATLRTGFGLAFLVIGGVSCFVLGRQLTPKRRAAPAPRSAPAQILPEDIVEAARRAIAESEKNADGSTKPGQGWTDGRTQ